MDVKELLKQAVNDKASDVHFGAGMPPTLRIHGNLTSLSTEPLSSDEAKKMLYDLITLDEQVEFEKNLVADIAYTLPEVGNFRLNAFHQLKGVGAVLRVLPKSVPAMDKLGLPSVLKSLLSLSHGLILVTGPTGSGKSTTLASMIETINQTRSCHIITIEDPIEYHYENKKSIINQLQIGRDTPDINIALKASMRQDPDVILLGEIRDLQTVNLALTAAETGHLVMSTLHAGSAPLAVSRIIDMFPNEEKNRVRNLLAETLQAALCQTLIRSNQFGRVAAFEIMLGTPAIRHQIRQDQTIHMHTTIQTNGHLGMTTMEQFVLTLVNKGVVSQSDARASMMQAGLFKD